MCPVCGKAMVVFEFEGVEIDRCVGCRGTWLDTGELARILEAGGASSDRWRNALENSERQRRSARRCPRCRRKLVEIRLEAAPPILLDHCPRGDGLWFDAGEMQTTIESFGDEGLVPQFFAELFQVEHRSKS